MKYAIPFLGIVAAGSAATVLSTSKDTLPELRHPIGRSSLAAQETLILVPRGDSESGRHKPSLSRTPPGQLAPSSSESIAKTRSRATSPGRDLGAASQTKPPQEKLTTEHRSGSVPRARPPQERPPPTYTPPNLPTQGSLELLNNYLHQEQGKFQAPGPYHLPARSRGTQLLDIIDQNRNRQLLQNGPPWQPPDLQNPSPYGLGRPLRSPDQLSPEHQHFLDSRRDHLLGLVSSASTRNVYQHQLELYERNRQRIGWGGDPISLSDDGNELPPEKVLGPGGFPNLVVPSSKTHDAPKARSSGIHPNPRLGRRDVSQYQAINPLPILIRREIRSHQLPSISSYLSLPSSASSSSSSSSSSRPQRRDFMGSPRPPLRRPPSGGPSGRPSGPRPTIAERLLWVGGPSRSSSTYPEFLARERARLAAAAAQVRTDQLNTPPNRATQQQSQPASPDTIPLQASQHTTPDTIPRQPSRPPTPSKLSQDSSRPASPHPLLAFLPSSIEGSVSASPASSRSVSPWRRLFDDSLYRSRGFRSSDTL